MAYVAFIAKTSIVACTKNLERLHTVHAQLDFRDLLHVIFDES